MNNTTSSVVAFVLGATITIGIFLLLAKEEDTEELKEFIQKVLDPLKTKALDELSGSELDTLLKKAIQQERYELAAVIKKLKDKSNPPSTPPSSKPSEDSSQDPVD